MGDELIEALRGVMGLVQLLTARDDLRSERQAILSNHRYVTAEQVLAKYETDEVDDDNYDCPIHGLQEGSDCPRC